MKFIWIVFFTVIPTYCNLFAQFIRVGDVTHASAISPQIGCGEYRLTNPSSNTSVGGLWGTEKIDLRQPFDFNFSLNFGRDPLATNNKGSGFSFVLQNTSNTFAPSTAASTMGTQGIGNSFCVEFDTYDNTADGISGELLPSGGDHTNIYLNGDVTNQIGAPALMNPFNLNIEDNLFHDIRIVWNPFFRTFEVYIDGRIRINQTISAPGLSQYFGGNNNVFMGIVAVGTNMIDQRIRTRIVPNFDYNIKFTASCFQRIQFINTSTTGFQTTKVIGWRFDNYTYLATDKDTVTYDYLTVGNKRVAIIVQDVLTGCIDSFWRNIVIEHTKMRAQFNIQNISCNGSADGKIELTSTEGAYLPLRYSWNYDPNNLTPIANNLKYDSVYIIYITDSVGCKEAFRSLVIEPLPISFPHPNIKMVTCEGGKDGTIEALPQGGNAPYTYSWDNGTTLALNQNLRDGNYEITVTDSKGCLGKASYKIYELSRIRFEHKYQHVGCNGEKNGFINIMPSGGMTPYTYVWKKGSIANFATTKDIYDIIADTYDLKIIDNFGCFKDTSFLILQPEQLIVSINPDSITIVLDEPVTLNLQSNIEPYRITWRPDDYFDCNDCMQPTFVPRIDQIYAATVEIMPYWKLCDTTVYSKVKVITPFFIPNSFTPNNDFKNDTFKIESLSYAKIKDFNIMIFNRNGEVVFQSTNVKFAWDGKQFSKPLPVDVYTYKYHMRYIDEQGFEDKVGTVNLIR